MLYGQHHNHVIISERILIIIVKFDYEPANLQHKFYKWVLLTLGLVEVCVLFGAEKLLVAQSVKMFPATFEPECQVPYLSEAATYRFFTRIYSTYTHLISYISILILFLLCSQVSQAVYSMQGFRLTYYVSGISPSSVMSHKPQLSWIYGPNNIW